MKKLFYLLLFILLFSSGCKSKSITTVNLPQDKNIQVYFNHRDTGDTQYTDDYRNVTRTGDNLEAVVIQAIEQAESSIDVAVQELQLPGIALALARQAQKGIEVRVILDNKYSRAISSFSTSEITKLPSRERDRFLQYFQLIDVDNNGVLNSQEIKNRDALIILENASIPLIDDTADGSKGSGLMHHKFIVIDGKTVITGSTNFTLSGIHGDLGNLDTRGNVNHLLEIDNRELAQLFTEEFNYMWSDRKFGLNKISRSPQTITWDKTKIQIQFSPISSKQDWSFSANGLIGQVLNNANNSIDLALFVFSDQNLADILQDKQQQGIKINALIDREFIFRYYSEALDMLGIAMVNKCQYEANNNPWNNTIQTVGTANLETGDKLHHKIALIDNNTIITGSQNWSAAANYLNDETVLIIENETVAKHFQQEFARLYQNANLGLPERIDSKIKEQQRKCS
jgi:phosphatidylserine/phosphatidylglycerophosphate/cardiolipin synthase-like enzyme